MRAAATHHSPCCCSDGSNPRTWQRPKLSPSTGKLRVHVRGYRFDHGCGRRAKTQIARPYRRSGPARPPTLGHRRQARPISCHTRHILDPAHRADTRRTCTTAHWAGLRTVPAKRFREGRGDPAGDPGRGCNRLALPLPPHPAPLTLPPCAQQLRHAADFSTPVIGIDKQLPYVFARSSFAGNITPWTVFFLKLRFISPPR